MPAPDSGEISYQQWGVDFFHEAVSAPRILAAVKGLAGRPIDFGPIGVGPGRLAKVKATGAIGNAGAQKLEGEQVRYLLTLPVDLMFELDLGVDKHTFRAAMEIPLLLAAQAFEGLRIHVEVTPPTADEVVVRLTPVGLRASVVSKVAGVEGELRRFVAKYVAKEVNRDDIAEARLIDVAGRIHSAWSTPGKAEEAVAPDLNEELARDLQDSFLAEGL